MTVRGWLTSAPTDGTVLRSWPRGRNVSGAGWRSGHGNPAAQPWRWLLAPRPAEITCATAQHQKGSNPRMTTSPTPATRTKVLLVDDHDLIRKGLRHAFERDRQF